MLPFTWAGIFVLRKFHPKTCSNSYMVIISIFVFQCYAFACVVSQYQELSEGRGTYEYLYKPVSLAGLTLVTLIWVCLRQDKLGRLAIWNLTYKNVFHLICIKTRSSYSPWFQRLSSKKFWKLGQMKNYTTIFIMSRFYEFLFWGALY